MKKLVNHAYDVSIRYVCNLLSPHSGLWRLVIGCITLLLSSINVSAQTTPFWGDVEPYLPNSTSTGTGVNTNMPLGSACNATCDYIANGNFSAISPTDISCGPMVNWNSANNRFIDCWNRYAGTPDLYTADCNHLSVSHEGVQEFTDSYVIGETGNAFVKNCSAGSNEASSPSGGNFIGLTANRDEDGDIMQEAIMTRFPIPLVNGVYIITIDAKVFCTDQENLNHAVFFRGSTSSGLSGLGPSGGGGGNNFDEADTGFENLGFFNATGSGWHTYTIPFTYTGNTPINYFIIGRQAFIDNSTCSYVMFDNVRLTRVNSTMGAIPPVCVETTLNLFDYTNLDYNQGSFSVLYNGVTTPLSSGIFTPHTPGNYIITYTPPNDNCPSSSTTLLVNYATTTASVSPSIACWGTSVQFSTPTVAPLPNSYQWTGPNGFSSTQQNPMLNAVTVPMSGVYSVSTTAANGCIATAHVSLQVRNNPVINVAVIPASCTTDGSATATASGGSAPYTYIWSNGATTANITGLIAGVYTVTTTDINGCTATGSATVGFTGIAGGQAVGDGVGIPNAGSAGAAAVLSLTSFYVVGSFNTGGVLNSNSLALTNQTVKMVPGAQIVVPNGKTFALRGCTVKAECQKLWKRILVENGGNLTTDASGANSQTTIRDGHYAVWLNNGAKTLIKNATFTDNFIGVYAPPNNSTGNTWVQSVGNMTGCTFTAASLGASILPPYAGAASTPIPLSSGGGVSNVIVPTTLPREAFAGIVLNDMLQNASIGTYGSVRNNFNKLRRGIMAIRCENTFINNSAFTTIGTSTINQSTLYEGHAISVIGSSMMRTSCFLNVRDGGQLPANPVTMNDVFMGIFADNVAVDIQDTKIQNTRSGINVISTPNRTHSVIGNNMDCRYRCIDFNNNKPSVANISDNTLALLSASALYPADVAISIADANTLAQANICTINNNIITLGTNAPTGIRVMSSYMTSIYSNNIYLNSAATNRSAIMLSGTREVHVNCNMVQANFNANDYVPSNQFTASTGLDVFKVTDGYYEQNDFNNTYNGALFKDICTNTNLRANIFSANYWGLYLTSSATIGNQRGPNPAAYPNYNYGNSWLGTHIGAKAKHTATSVPQVGLSKIYYDNTANLPQFLPTYAPPINQFSLSNGVSWYNWFIGQPVPYTYGFSTELPANDCSDISGDMTKSTLEGAIANGTVASSIWEAYVNRTADKDLLAKLKDNSALLTDPDFLTFFYDMLNTKDAAFYDVKAEQTAAFDIAAADKAQLEAWDITLASLNEQLDVTYKQYDLPNADVAALDIQVGVLNLQIQDIKQQKDYLVSGYAAQMQQKLADAQSDNAVIVDADQYEANEKTVNAIYASTFALGNRQLSTEQLQNLHDVAIQCPLSGGQAVWTARALYANFASLDYDDVTNCLVVGHQLKETTANNYNAEVKLYPNPASAILNIELPLFESGDINITLTDMLGRVVQNQVIAQGSTFTSLNTGSLQNGVYVVNIRHEDTILLNDKVTIMNP